MTSTAADTRYRVYLATAPNHKVHMRMAWQSNGQAQCDRYTTVMRDLVQLDPDGGLDATIAAVVAQDIPPALLCKKCFALRTRVAISQRWARVVAERGRIVRGAVVDAQDLPADLGDPDCTWTAPPLQRLQVRAVGRDGATAYLVPLGQVFRNGGDGGWWSLDSLTLVPADQITADAAV